MEALFAVFNSDAISRDGTWFSLATLEDILWQTALTGVPSNLGHDSHRPVGWAQPTGLYFQPGMVRSTGLLLLPETTEEDQAIRERHTQTYAHQQQERAAPYLAKLQGELHGHATGAARYLTCEALACLEPGLVESVFPELSANLDKAGLIYLSDLLKNFYYKSHGVFQHRKRPLLVFAHPYFRRSLSRANNFHWAFLDELMQRAANPKILVRLRLDGEMVGYAPSFLEPLEYEYWHGPKFSDDISRIPDGLTRHTASAHEHRYYGVQRTEFIWRTEEEPTNQDNKLPRVTHTFELEEVQDTELPANGAEDTYGCRYVHSIYDQHAETFEHFDGAIRLYDLEQMAERVDTDMDKAGHQSLYTKLFRIDDKRRLLDKQTGPGLALNEWKSLVASYMQGNPLIAEYFQATKEPQVSTGGEADTILDEASDATSQVMPASMQPGDGVRLQVAYRAKGIFDGPDRQMIGYSVFTRGSQRQSVIEYDVVELRKALRRLGTDLFIPPTLIPLCCEDGYLNIPTIFHGGPHPEATLATTVQALTMLVEALSEQQRDDVWTFTLSWNAAERQVSLSVLGHVADLRAWLRHAGSPPTTREKFVAWLERQKNYLNSLPMTQRAAYPLVETVLKSDGSLYIKRQPEHRLSAAQVEAVRTGQLTLATSWQPQLIECSVCGADYWQCPHSTVLDAGVRATIVEAQQISRFWTDRS